MAPLDGPREPALFERVRQYASALPGAVEGTSYGTPAFHAGKKLFIRLREDGETLVLRVDPYERDALLAAHPDALFLTDHYRPYPWVLVRLPAVEAELLRELVEEARRLSAPPRLRAARRE